MRAALDGDDAGELFAWLCERSFVESGAYGAFPHDLAREVIDADLRWRDRRSTSDARCDPAPRRRAGAIARAGASTSARWRT